MKMSILYLLLFFLLFIPLFSSKINDPLIFDVIQLTKSGDHSFPIFSRDSRKILFSASGEQYGTKCPHIYELDLKHYDKLPASLFSTGIGHESQVIFYENDLYSIVSTTYKALEKLYENPKISGTKFNNDYFCPKSQCGNPKDEVLREICPKPHTEHFDRQTLTRINYKSGLVKSFNFYNESYMQYQSQHVSLSGNYEDDDKAYAYSQKCDTGECIMLYETVSKTHKPIIFGGGVFDGFNNYKYRITDLEYEFFFHGYETKNETVLNLIKQGISPLEGSKIFSSVKGEDGFTFPCILENDPITYVYPKSFPSVFGVSMQFALATGINSTNNKMAIYLIENPFSTYSPDPQYPDYNSGDLIPKPTIIVSDKNVNTFRASIDLTGQYIVFVSDRDGNGNQLYLGKFNNSKLGRPQFDAIEPETQTFPLKSIANATRHTKQYEFKIDYPTLNSNGLLMFMATSFYNECAQIYQIDSKLNDLLAIRKISNGIHHYSSPNFLPNGDIIFASTLTEKILDPLNLKCTLKLCTNGNYTDPELEEACEGVIEEYSLPKHSELYISNQYGSLKERLTENDVFDGEVVISPDQTKIVYSSLQNGDYELFEMDLSDKAIKRQITKKLGFERSVTYSPNGELIAYVGTRPKTNEEIEMYKKRVKYDFVDIGQSKIYVFSFVTGKECEIETPQPTNAFPGFLTNENLIFMAYKNESGCILYGSKIETKNDINVGAAFVIENNWPCMQKMYVNPLMNKTEYGYQLVFTRGNAEFNSLYVSENFKPDFGSGHKLRISFKLIVFIIMLVFFL